MFEIQNKIIAIDDNQDHLIRLGKEFLACGLGCRTIQFEASYNTPLKNVRLAFFDINLMGKTIDLNQENYNYEIDRNLSSVFNDLSIAIQSYIDINNGPYGLIFWSSNTVLINNFIKYVNDRNLSISKPIFIDGLNKDEYIGQSNDQSQFTIKDKIATILENTPIKLLFDFEESVNQAGSFTINEIYNLIPSDDSWGDNSNFIDNFDLIFSKLASNTVGFEHAKNNPDNAIMEALAATIHYNLISKTKSKGWKEFLKNITNKTLQYPDNFTPSKLNSIFHIDSTSEIDFSKRGAVFEFNYKYFPVESDCWNYFEKMNEYSKEIFGRFVQINDTETTPTERDFIRGKSKFVLIEISASCDYSQNRIRNQKFVLGLLTPPIDVRKINFALQSESVLYKDLPLLNYNNQDINLWINFNFSFSDFEINKNIGEPLFILRKEIIDMIGNRYANHISRIGIMSF